MQIIRHLYVLQHVIKTQVTCHLHLTCIIIINQSVIIINQSSSSIIISNQSSSITNHQSSSIIINHQSSSSSIIIIITITRVQKFCCKLWLSPVCQRFNATQKAELERPHLYHVSLIEISVQFGSRHSHGHFSPRHIPLDISGHIPSPLLHGVGYLPPSTTIIRQSTI